jgi:hypothetical protein
MGVIGLESLKIVTALAMSAPEKCGKTIPSGKGRRSQVERLVCFDSINASSGEASPRAMGAA